MKPRAALTAIVAVGLAVLAGNAAGQSNCTQIPRGPGASSLPASINQLTANAQAPVVPDLSNPGARALALGGAFVSTADDTTATVANPAGLAVGTRAQAQVELRSSPSFQLDSYGTGWMDPSAGRFRTDGDPYKTDESQMTPFAAVIYPLGDIFVVGGVYQVVKQANRDVNRLSNLTEEKGPCFYTDTARGDRNYFVPLYRFSEDLLIDRFGVSVAVRALPRLSLGVSVFLNREDRSQVFERGWFNNLPAADGYRETVETSSNKVSFIGGLIFTPNEALRFGLSYSSKVDFDKRLKTFNVDANTGNAFVGTTVPSRYTAGLAVTPSSRWLISGEASLARYSEGKDNIDFSQMPLVKDANPTPVNLFDIDDALELRVGIEHTVVQTRTVEWAIRLGGFIETAHRLRYVGPKGTEVSLDDRLGVDLASVLFPRDDDESFKHLTVGIGTLQLNRRLQLDVGFDHEFVTEVNRFSALVGWTF